jgi:hypothetical protein
MKKYLMVEIAEITEAQKVERQLYALYEDEVRRIYFENDEWLDCETACSVYEAPKFYLPDGLPDPNAAVEVFESEASQEYIHPTTEYGCGAYGDWKTRLPDAMISLDSDGLWLVNEGTKLGVFALPSGKVKQEGE